MWYCAAALAEAECGHLEEARRHLELALGPTGVDRLPRNEWFLMSAGTAALVCWRIGDGVRADAILRALLPHRRFLLGNVAPVFGTVAHVAGVAAMTAGRLEDAGELLEEARSTSRRLASPPWEAEVALAQDALARLGGPGVAGHHDPLGRGRSVQDVLAGISVHGEQPAAAGRSTLGNLTGREREVLALIAAGRSNHEIAAQLYISYRTTKTHVSNILSKLGARDRTEAAALARDLRAQ
jgi:DNA-binding CsgD family transcriptional regulator